MFVRVIDLVHQLMSEIVELVPNWLFIAHYLLSPPAGLHSVRRTMIDQSKPNFFCRRET